MNTLSLPALVTGAVLSLSAFTSAAVPSLINYQGRLTDSNGDPVTGAKNFTLTIYDAATAGNVLYTENIGAVTLDEKGIYQFQFGDAGTSNTEVTETVGTTDGVATSYPKTLSHEPVVANSVSVTDGTYTLTSLPGSSGDGNFSAFYNSSARQVTVFYSSAPAAGIEVKTTYHYETGGISGALAGSGEQWMAIGVDGTEQGARQRVLAVPFANRAAVADKTLSIDEKLLDFSTLTLSEMIDDLAFGEASKFYIVEEFPVSQGLHNLVDSGQLCMIHTGSSMTSKIPNITASTGLNANTKITSYSINAYVASINLTCHSYENNPNGDYSIYSASLKYNYADNSSSESLNLSPSVINLVNLNPEKKVISVTITARSTNNIKISTVISSGNIVILDPVRSLDLLLKNLSEETSSLRLFASGDLSDSGDFDECCEWAIRYNDGSLSTSAPLKGTILLAAGKTAVSVRVATIPSKLLDRDLDLKKVMIRFNF